MNSKMNSKINFLLLKLRNAIADKEWVIASANHETAHFDHWSCGWNEGVLMADKEVEKIIAEIEKEMEIEKDILDR